MQYVYMYICSGAAFYFTCLRMKTHENNDPHVPLGLFRQDIPKLGHDLCGASNRKSGGRAELTLYLTRPVYKWGYVYKEIYPQCLFMVQYLHFRVLKLPLNR